MFDITKKIDLSYLGEEWKDCYISFAPLSIAEVRKLPQMAKATDDPVEAEKNIDVILNLLREKFLGGEGIKEGKRVPIKKEDIDQLPADLVIDIMASLNGGLDKKKLNLSQMPSEE